MSFLPFEADAEQFSALAQLILSKEAANTETAKIMYFVFIMRIYGLKCPVKFGE